MAVGRFQSYTESEDGIEVSYTEAGEPKQIRCKLLVGADGYFSAVRQQCLADGPPDFAVSSCQLNSYQQNRKVDIVSTGARMLERKISAVLLVLRAAWQLSQVTTTTAKHAGSDKRCE